MADLDDLDDILRPARGQATPREHVELAIQALLYHQFIYEDTRGIGPSYDVLRRHRAFFDRYFSAMGYRLTFEPREGLVCLLPGASSFGWRETRLRKDETLVLLALRYLLEAGVMQGRLSETGRVDASTDEVFDAIKTITQTEPPAETRLEEILAEYRRRGLVRVEARDLQERVTPIVILPAVRHICTDEFARHIVAWSEASIGDKGDGDILDFIAARRAADVAAVAVAGDDVDTAGVDADPAEAGTTAFADDAEADPVPEDDTVEANSLLKHDPVDSVVSAPPAEEG